MYNLYYSFYLIFDQINAALLSIKDKKIIVLTLKKTTTKNVKKCENHVVHNLYVLAEAFPQLAATVPLALTQSDV